MTNISHRSTWDQISNNQEEERGDDEDGDEDEDDNAYEDAYEDEDGDDDDDADEERKGRCSVLVPAASKIRWRRSCSPP